MKFWDTSAIIPLLVEELKSDYVERLFIADSSMIVWWGTSIECVSAVSRLERENKISAREAEKILLRLSELRQSWREILPSNKSKQITERILRVHPLRAPDAQQLAGCVIANSDCSIEFVTLDKRLENAANKEGLPVISETMND